MGNFIDCEVTGDLTSGFDRLLEAAGESTLRATGFAGADVFRQEAILRVPVKEGIIKKNIIVKRAEELSDGNLRQVYLVTVRTGKHGKEGDAYYWKWVENGHKFVPRKAKKVAWKVHRAAAELEYGTSTKGAKPFMRPSYEAKKDAAIKAMKVRFAGKLKEYLGGS